VGNELLHLVRRETSRAEDQNQRRHDSRQYCIVYNILFKGLPNNSLEADIIDDAVLPLILKYRYIYNVIK